MAGKYAGAQSDSRGNAWKMWDWSLSGREKLVMCMFGMLPKLSLIWELQAASQGGRFFMGIIYPDIGGIVRQITQLTSAGIADRSSFDPVIMGVYSIPQSVPVVRTGGCGPYSVTGPLARPPPSVISVSVLRVWCRS